MAAGSDQVSGPVSGPVMQASEIGRAARQDLQLRVPRRPVVRRGVRVRPEDGAWVVEGARKGRVLRGQFAREHMGALVEACDGTHDVAQVGEILGIGEQSAFAAVSLLWTGGVVEEGDTRPLASPPVEPELACLLSRLGDSTGVNDSWQDAARRLAAARVAVIGSTGGTGLTEGAEAAEEAAKGLVRALEPTLAARLAEGPQEGDTLVVLVETAATPGAAGQAGAGATAAAPVGGLADPVGRPGPSARKGRAAAPAVTRSAAVAGLCWELGVPLLRVRVEHEAVRVGPYVDRDFSSCLECGTAGEPALGPAPGPGRRDLAVGLAARAVAALVSRAANTHLPGDVRRTDLATLAYSDRPATTRPGCPVCSVAGGPGVPVAASAPVGARYEQSVAIPPAAFMDPKGHQQHYQPANLRLQHEFRDWPSCPRTPLPPADLAALERPWPAVLPEPWEPAVVPGSPHAPGGRHRRHCPTPQELATVLALAAGVREPVARGASGSGGEAAGGKVRRWTAAGGNIGSVGVYVLVPDRSDPVGGQVPAGRPGTVGPREPLRQPGGGAGARGDQALAPGAYAYVEQEHALALVGPAVVLPQDVGVRLILTGNVDKLARKYLAFALRIAVQDCGCSLEVARLVARALGVPLRARARWDDQEVAAALGTDPVGEPVCAVLDLGDGPGPGDGWRGAGGPRAH